jgi:hypothetical protein
LYLRDCVQAHRKIEWITNLKQPIGHRLLEFFIVFLDEFVIIGLFEASDIPLVGNCRKKIPPRLFTHHQRKENL